MFSIRIVDSNMKSISCYDGGLYFSDIELNPENRFLSSIDPYGTTYFSYWQIHNYVIPELQNIENNPRIKTDIHNLIIYLQGIESNTFCQVLGD